MLKQRGSASSGTKPTERKNVEEDYNSRLNKMQKEEYLIKNACYSVTKYYLCKQNNKRSLLGRKQRNQVTRSFLNRYQFSSTNKVTSLFSTSCILRIILPRQVRLVWNPGDGRQDSGGNPVNFQTGRNALRKNIIVLFFAIEQEGGREGNCN